MKITQIEAFALRYQKEKTSRTTDGQLLFTRRRLALHSTHATTKQWSCESPHQMALSAMVRDKVRFHRAPQKQSSRICVVRY